MMQYDNEFINLGGAELESIPEEIFNITTLKRLYLYNIYPKLYKPLIKIIPKEIKFLVNLVELNLACNHITTLPIEIAELTKIKILDLTDNRLSSLPNLSNMISLELLIFIENKIVELPQLPNSICKINGGHNKITKLNLCNLYNLRIIYLPFNEIENVNDSITTLTQLEILYLYRNNIKYFPKITNMTRLKYVNITGSSIIISSKYEYNEKEKYNKEIYNYA